MIIDLSSRCVRDMVDDADIFRYHIFGEMIFAVLQDLVDGTFLRRCKRNGNMENTICTFYNDCAFQNMRTLSNDPLDTVGKELIDAIVASFGKVYPLDTPAQK